MQSSSMQFIYAVHLKLYMSLAYYRNIYGTLQERNRMAKDMAGGDGMREQVNNIKDCNWKVQPSPSKMTLLVVKYF